jgi:hypothetical protein
MKRHWQVSRAGQPHAEAARRWDRAYQLVLEWAGVAFEPDPSSPQPETTDASSHLRPRLDPAPNPDPDH